MSLSDLPVDVERSLAAENHSTGGRIRFLDGWRAVAISGVLIDHFAGTPGINLGRTGVELFFVLSGRLMAQILFIEKAPLPYFFYRRFSRVWPTMAICVCILAVFASALLHKPIRWHAIISGLTYTYNYVGVRARPLDHLWSLCVEEHTYIFFGLTAFFSRRFAIDPIKTILFAIVLCQMNGWISTYQFTQDYYATYWRSDVRMCSILLGAFAFLLLRRRIIVLKGYQPSLLLAVGLAFNLALFPDPVKYSVGSACLALSVASIELDTSPLRQILCHPLLAWVGLISFSIYLWQQPFLSAAPHFTFKPLLIVPALIAGCTSFYLLENPSRLFLNARTPKWARKS